MSKLMKKAAVILMAFVVTMSMMPLAAGTVYAETKTYEDVNINGFEFVLYDDNNDGSGIGVGSVWIMGYTGTATEVVIPTTVTTEGVTFTASPSAFDIHPKAFSGNTKITKIAIPSNISGISDGAFSGCTSLIEVSIGSLDDYDNGGIGNGAFTGCTSLVTYNIDSSGMDSVYAGDNSKLEELQNQIINAGIGIDDEGNPIAGVSVYTQSGSVVWQAIETINESRPDGKKIKLVDSDDPYERSTISEGSDSDGSDGSDESGDDSDGSDDGSDGSDGSDEPVIDSDQPGDGSSEPAGSSGGSKTKKQMGKDGTAYGKGASEATVDKAITKYGKEKDPKGTKFGLLKARLTKTTNRSITLKWSKVKGAKKYVIYANACSLKKPVKLVKQKKVKASTSKWVCKKINKKKLKKGTYYKFVVVALDKKGNVISTSKIVHAATKGGKAGNDKAVKTNAKKNKVTIKKGKKFKLKAKAVPQSKKKKVYRHRGIAYESSNPKVATVSSKGVIKGKKKGTCYVYAYAQNGVFKKIKVTVTK